MWKIIRHPLFLYVVFVYLLFALCSNFAAAQTAPACTSNWIYRSCSSYPVKNSPCDVDAQGGILVSGPSQKDEYAWTAYYCNPSCYGFSNFAGYYGGKCNYMSSSCPEGQSWRNDGASASCQPDNVATPQECGITGFPVWNGSGYTCEANFNTPCPEGTVNGNYTLPGYDPRPYCADANPPASSASSVSSTASSSGQNSSSNNSDGEGDGSGSSSGDTGNSSASSSSTGSGSGSSGSASSSGQGGSASSVGAGECDPTSNEYLDCLTPSGGMPDHTETGSGAQSFSDVNGDFMDGLMGTGIMDGMAGMVDAIQLQSASCPVLEMDLSNTIVGRSLSTDIHCVIWAEVNDPLEIVMYAVWLFAAFRIFASA